MSVTESVVQLTIVGGAVKNDVVAVLTSPGGCGEGCGGPEREEGVGTPAGVCARVGACNIASACVTVRIIVDLLVMSSERMGCDRIDGNGSVSSLLLYTLRIKRTSTV